MDIKQQQHNYVYDFGKCIFKWMNELTGFSYMLKWKSSFLFFLLLCNQRKLAIYWTWLKNACWFGLMMAYCDKTLSRNFFRKCKGARKNQTTTTTTEHDTKSKERHLHKSHMHLITINIKRTWHPAQTSIGYNNNNSSKKKRTIFESITWW